MRDLNREWALRYAEAGISVFPCTADTRKRPLIRWREGSTTNAAHIAALWNRWPCSLVGIDLHKCGLVVLDADRHDNCADGVAAFAALVRRHRADLSVVPITHTPSNGYHFYFRQPPDPLGNREGDLPDGINVRGSGGFAVAPFCVRPDGQGYRSVAGHPSLIAAFQAGTIPIAPDWLIEIVRKPACPEIASPSIVPTVDVNVGDACGDNRERAWASTALQSCIANLSNCPNGHRNNTLNAVAYRLGRIVARGWLDRGTVEGELQAAAQSCGLVADDGIATVKKSIASGLNAGIKLPVPDLRERSR
jgi:Bifunctional DNA primase/polymerase, N-terminal